MKLRNYLKYILISSFIFPLLYTSAAIAAPMYRVVITNITKAQSFTPILIASHSGKTSIATVGSAASSELETLAESGSPTDLKALLDAETDVSATEVTAGLLMPGESVTAEISAQRAKRLSLVSMVVPSNDTFVFLDSAPVSKKKGELKVFYAFAYDSGTEVNDELCTSVAGPAAECTGGAGTNESPTAGAEGFIHIANGIQGVGGLIQSTRDWRGPVARVTVERVRRK